MQSQSFELLADTPVGYLIIVMDWCENSCAGLAKHHICNANLFRNGADFSVFINTAQPFDCSDSGADPDEAVSWGKIRIDAKPVKVYGDAAMILPLLISQTFAKTFEPVV